MSDRIKLEVRVEYESSHSKETEFGKIYGREIVETLEISAKEAQKLIQNHIVDIMDYKEAQEFIKRYSK